MCLAPTASAAAPAAPKLRLLVGSGSVTLNRSADDPYVNLHLGSYVVSEGAPFEVRLKRKSYRDPIVATQVIRNGKKVRNRKLPAGSLKHFDGMHGFLHVTLKNAQGAKVYDKYQAYCPNTGESSRVRPQAPSDSPYPEFGCPWNAFTLGAVWGIQRGWAAPTSSPWDAPQVKLADGKYTATITVAQRYRKLFGITGSPKTVKVTVRTRPDEPGDPMKHRHGNIAKPNAAPPTGAASVPKKGPKPDLRSLPAFDIQTTREAPKPGAAKRDYLNFAANVWNAGSSPLVVDGFRKRGKALMDAYQYFYNTKGKQVGYARTGTFEWDAREGHHHWHFLDFASYRLLKADKKLAVRSQKESFCLANTDAVDFTIKYANWKPDNTDLHTSCGEQSSLSIREVLDVGSGDTYQQNVAGQSFDINNLPNGTYYIQVIANPSRRLYELKTGNNVSLRKVILGGKPGARTVKVPPVGLVNAG